MKQAHTKTVTSKDLKTTFKELTSYLEDFFTKKAPALPDTAKEVIVKFAPIITLVILVLALPPILALIGLSTLITPFAFVAGPSAGLGLTISMLFLVATLVLEALSIPGLMARQLRGWNFAYYGAWLSALHSLFSSNILSAIISFALSMWILFQVKSYYTK